MLRFILFLPALLLAFSALSQSGPETWQTESFENLRTNQGQTYTSVFKVYADRIDWIQGVQTQTFPVTSREGSLPANGNGSITYHLTKDDKDGKILIERIGQNTTLTIDFSEELELGANYRFKVFKP